MKGENAIGIGSNNKTDREIKEARAHPIGIPIRGRQTVIGTTEEINPREATEINPVIVRLPHPETETATRK